MPNSLILVGALAASALLATACAHPGREQVAASCPFAERWRWEDLRQRPWVAVGLVRSVRQTSPRYRITLLEGAEWGAARLEVRHMLKGTAPAGPLRLTWRITWAEFDSFGQRPRPGDEVVAWPEGDSITFVPSPCVEGADIPRP